jgi:putative ABC transport system permease protein
MPSEEAGGSGPAEQIVQLYQDVRQGARQLRRNPGFAVVAVLTLALGIGANTVIFSLVNTVLLRPLPYSHPERLYLVREIIPQWAKFAPSMAANLPNFQIWRKQVRSFEDVTLAESTSAILSGAGDPVRVHGVRSSANLFEFLGVRPAQGRGFLPEEDEAGRGRVVMLSDEFWRGRFQADPSIVGRTIVLDGTPHQVVGILPPSFEIHAALYGLSRVEPQQDFFLPLDGPRSYEQELIGEFDFSAIARLRPGVTPAAALAELDSVQAQIAQQAHEGLDLRGQLLPLEEVVAGPARRGLIFLFAAVAAVLLIVCANLAGLLLARIPSRMREAAVRRALGATRLRLIRQLLAESLLLSAGGGVLGVFFASLGVQWMTHLTALSLPRLSEVHMDARVLGFMLFLTALTGILCSVLPAWRITRAQPYEALKSAAASTTHGVRIRHARQTLVGCEVGLATLLLILAGLFTASLVRLLRMDPGFAVDNVLAADVDLPEQSYPLPANRIEFYTRALDGIRALPGVRGAGWITLMPLTGQGSVNGIGLPGRLQSPEENPHADYRPVSSGYFSAMGIPLLQGRVFTEADRGRRVVLVSKSVADRLWPGKSPIGQTCVTQWAGDVESEVIGVVGDVRTVRLEDSPLLMVYVPDWFNRISAPSSASIIVHTSLDPASLVAAVRTAIQRVDAGVPIVAMRPMTQILSKSVAPRRFQVFLILAFALSSLFLAGLGIFGVVAYSVEQRRSELGIRMALGAQFSDLRRMVLRQGMMPVAGGLAAGILGAVVFGRLLESLLFEVSAFDPVTISTVGIVVAGVAFAACYLPARRVAGLDPIVALRYE